MSFPEFTDETRILPASKAFVLFWAERISVPFTTFGYRQITFLSTYPWETYLMLALLTFLRVCACVCSILCFSVHLFSVVSEISPATPPKGSPLQGAPPSVGPCHPNPPPCLVSDGDATVPWYSAGPPPAQVQVQMSIFKVRHPRVLLPASHCPPSLACDLTPLLKLLHISGKQPDIVATHTDTSKSSPKQHADDRALYLPNCLSIIT